MHTATLIAEQVHLKSSSVIGWATGGTMLGVYRSLRDMNLSFQHTRAFNLDEYIGLPAAHPQSYHHYMRHNFFDHVGMPEAQCHIPDGGCDPEHAIAKYEALLAAHGPIDLQLLGLGKNGHIGFNEPGASFNGTVHKTVLSPTTIEANARYFEASTDVPREAITMGIKTILSARKIVLLACGHAKADAVAEMIEGVMSITCPATALQLHDDVTIVLDSAAASELQGCEPS